MKLRIIQWNICFNSDAESIAQLLLRSIRDRTVVNLQEVSASSNAKLIAALRPAAHSYSLDLRAPGNHEGRNRQMGVATFVFGGEIRDQSLVQRSLFPERTLVTNSWIDGINIRVLNFHSLTGVDYKKAKSSNFSTLADFMTENALDFMACDANEPQTDSLMDEEVEFFDNRDKGRCAGLILGPNPAHDLQDSYKAYLLGIDNRSDRVPLAISHVVGGRPRRYDHIYSSKRWQVTNVSYEYDEAINASSDHAIVTGDFSLRENGQIA